MRGRAAAAASRASAPPRPELGSSRGARPGAAPEERPSGRASLRGIGARAPEAFRPGYEATRPSNPELTDSYVAHLSIGDPDADAVIDELADVPPGKIDEFVRVLLESDRRKGDSAPRALREFVDRSVSLPQWYRSVPVQPGSRGFFRQSDLFMTAFGTSTIVRGFSTTIALSFFMTGKVLAAARARLRHNTRHLFEIMLPGGLEPYGDGWRLAIRTRLIHARARKLIAGSGHWDAAAYGLPVSAAHGALASAGFSAMLLDDATRLGARMDDEERASFMHIWRCSAWLMGVPESLLCGSESDGHELVRIGFGCEPPPASECIVMANALISAVPHVVGIEDEAGRRKMADALFRLARRMIGRRMADSLGLPRKWSVGMIALFKLRIRLHKLRNKMPFFKGRDYGVAKLTELLDSSRLVDEGVDMGFRYRLPTHLHSADRSEGAPAKP